MAAWGWDLHTPGFAIIISRGLFSFSLEYSLILGLCSGSVLTFILCGFWQYVALDFVSEDSEGHSTSSFRIIVSGVGHALTQLIIDPQQGRTRLWTELRNCYNMAHTVEPMVIFFLLWDK